jgi:hypothetical protein
VEWADSFPRVAAMERESRLASSSDGPNRPLWKVLALIALPFVAALAYYLGSHYFETPCADAGQSSVVQVSSPLPIESLPPELFRRWGEGKPDLAIVLSGQTFGYLQPCGCSQPQYGGLTRRYNLVQLLRKKGWNVTAVDLGDLYPHKKESIHLIDAQAKEKYKTVLKAMNVMQYEVYGIGALELKMPLLMGLADAMNLGLAKPKPMVLNLQDPNKVFKQLGVQQYAIIDQGVKVGVTSMVGASLEAKLQGDPNLAFFRNDKMLPLALKEFAKANVDVTIAFLHPDYEQSNPNQPPPNATIDAEKCAKFCDDHRQKNPNDATVDLIAYASAIDVAPEQPEKANVNGKFLNSPRLLPTGHKGKDVGVIGLFKQANGKYEIKYQRIPLGPEFDTPKAAEPAHPVMKLMEEYAATVKAQDFLGQAGKFRIMHDTQKILPQVDPKVDARYVGSAECSRCHAKEYAVWQNSPHAKAFQDLVNAKNPGLRQFDPECITCHVTGFRYQTGYLDPPPGANANKIQKLEKELRNVGCESCHGPASMHANAPNNKAFYPIINPPWMRVVNGKNLKLEFFCMQCHDIENDVHWGNPGRTFEDNWKRIVHPRTKQDEQEKK